MAQRIITQLVSDLSGEDIPEGGGRTVDLTFDGATYSIDLTDTEIATLEQALQPYLDVATRKRAQRTVGTFKIARPGPDSKTLRAWADANGFSLGDRGRIPQEVKDAYAAAHPSS